MTKSEIREKRTTNNEKLLIVIITDKHGSRIVPNFLVFRISGNPDLGFSDFPNQQSSYPWEPNCNVK